MLPLLMLLDNDEEEDDDDDDEEEKDDDTVLKLAMLHRKHQHLVKGTHIYMIYIYIYSLHDACA